MTEAPHLFVSVTVEIKGHVAQGVSADGLPPKWFTKNPDTTFEQDDLPAMLRVIRHAADLSQQIGERASFFDWWREIYAAQHLWASQQDLEQLLSGFGVSLIERAVLDALCRHVGLTLFDVLRRNAVNIDFGAIRPTLRAVAPADVLPRQPRSRVGLRHTVGLGDAISNRDETNIAAPADGLPFTLEENITSYGLRYFKIKLSGDTAVDQHRLEEIANVIERTAIDSQFTLDGNESYPTMKAFRDAWSELLQSETIRRIVQESLLFVEQPVHRSSALTDDIAIQLASWPEAPPIIIDESDADLDSLPRALALGYSGTSHKNCKGIIKSLLNRATLDTDLHKANQQRILSAEDLGNVGPVALLQDLAMVAALGIAHVERNGHHYFAGLSMYSESIQESLLVHHRDIFARQPEFVALSPRNGQLVLDSINKAPFGLAPFIEVDQFDPWEF